MVVPFSSCVVTTTCTNLLVISMWPAVLLVISMWPAVLLVISMWSAVLLVISMWSACDQLVISWSCANATLWFSLLSLSLSLSLSSVCSFQCGCIHFYFLCGDYSSCSVRGPGWTWCGFYLQTHLVWGMNFWVTAHMVRNVHSPVSQYFRYEQDFCSIDLNCSMNEPCL